MNTPESSNKYHKTKIYKLEHVPSGYFYIGSTTQSLCNRLRGHRQNARERPSPVHTKFTELGWDHVKIILIQQIKCENKEEQLKEENKYIAEKRTDPLCLNSKMAYRKKGEYYQENKDLINQQKKFHYEENKEEINNRNREYYHAHKEENKPHRKQYNIDNREHKAEYDRIYRENNSEKKKAQKSKVELCVCGSTFTHDHKARHERTLKHQEFLKII